eukprot:1160908-Pelagomonas_calceolata.AAC.4
MTGPKNLQLVMCLHGTPLLQPPPEVDGTDFRLEAVSMLLPPILRRAGGYASLLASWQSAT